MKKYSDMSKEELLTLKAQLDKEYADIKACLLYTSPSPRD